MAVAARGRGGAGRGPTSADVGGAVHVHAEREHHVLRTVAVDGQLAVLQVRPHEGEQHARVHGGRVRRQVLDGLGRLRHHRGLRRRARRHVRARLALLRDTRA